MRKNYLFEPDVKETIFKVNNLAELTDYAEGMVAEEEVKALNVSSVPLQYVEFVIERMYGVDDKIYATSGDGYLYEKNGDDFVQKFKRGTLPPIMAMVIINGVKEVLYVDETGGRIIDKDEYVVSLPYGDYFATYSLRCFSAKDYTVYFSNPFDFDLGSMALDVCGNLKVNVDDGKIVGLFDFTNYLLIVCERCFYKLTITDGEFKFEKIKTDCYAINEKSLAKIREKLLFFADGKFFVYENFTVKEIPSVFSKNVIQTDYYATIDGDYYYCQENADINCVFIYDVIKKTSAQVYVGSSKLVCKNILYNCDDQRIYLLKTNSKASSTWRSAQINLGTNEKKNLLELSINVAKQSTLDISGDFGKKSFSLKAGINKKTMNLRSKEFVFEINCTVPNMVISDLQLKYIA